VLVGYQRGWHDAAAGFSLRWPRLKSCATEASFGNIKKSSGNDLFLQEAPTYHYILVKHVDIIHDI
jgi:hypothetical protein